MRQQAIRTATSTSACDLFASIDWSRTPLGRVDTWPQRLRATAEIVLAGRYPMAVLWGPDLITAVYNDAFAALIGARHPRAMGEPTRVTFPQTWLTNAPLFAEVVGAGRDYYFENAPRTVERNGQWEQIYLTISYSPLRSDDGTIGGVLATMIETTRNVLAERRLRSLRELAARTARARSLTDLGALAAGVFSENPYDLTFAVVSATIGGDRGHQADWAIRTQVVGCVGLDASDADDVEAVARAVTGDGGTASIALGTRRHGDPYPSGASDQPTRDAYVAALPQSSGGEPLGFVVFGLSATLPRDERYEEYVQLLTAQLAAAFENAMLFRREKRIADTLQRAALPGTLPVVAGLRVDAVYETGSDEAKIGGDWYDIFELRDGRVAMSIGDVAGTGVIAAATMGAARHMIRALAQTLDNPVDILNAVDGAFRLQNADTIVTAFVGVFSADHRRLSYASAGHPPPFLRHADGRIEALFKPNLPIGLRDNTTSAAAQAWCEAGSTVVLYTDGLTEATHDAIEGERRLRDALASAAFVTQSKKAAFLYEHVLDERANDDVALLVVEIRA